MVSVKTWALAGSALLLGLGAAGAADLSLAPPPPPVPFDPSGWYLRGDIGFSNQQLDSIYNILESAPGVTSVATPHKTFDAAPLFGIGVGYQFNSWLRADVTGEYRGKSNFHGLQIVSINGVPFEPDQYTASKSEWVAMANLYVDLGTWWSVTPFVGAGIGVSRNTISSFVDMNVPVLGVGYSGDASKWNFAWAVHAGLAYKVTPGLTIELAYRYIDLGDAISGDILAYTGANTVNNPEYFNGITSHDIKLGVRWMLNSPEPVYAPPLMRKG